MLATMCIESYVDSLKCESKKMQIKYNIHSVLKTALINE